DRRTPACLATALTDVRAGPSMPCNSTALSVMRTRVRCSASARRFFRYLRFWPAMAVHSILTHSPLPCRFNATLVSIQRRHAMKAAQATIGDGLMVSSEEKTRIEDSRRRLVWHGMFLFLLGLLTGFVEQNVANPRMGLAAHLEGVMNGTFLVALGAIWTTVR